MRISGAMTETKKERSRILNIEIKKIWIVRFKVPPRSSQAPSPRTQSICWRTYSSLSSCMSTAMSSALHLMLLAIPPRVTRTPPGRRRGGGRGLLGGGGGGGGRSLCFGGGSGGRGRTCCCCCSSNLCWGIGGGIGMLPSWVRSWLLGYGGGAFRDNAGR